MLGEQNTSVPSVHSKSDKKVPFGNILGKTIRNKSVQVVPESNQRGIW